MGEEAPSSGREKIRVSKSESSTVPFGLTKTSELELHGEDELIENTQLNIHWTQHKDDPNWDEFQGYAVRDPDHPLRCCKRQEALYAAVDGQRLWVLGGHLFAETPGAPGSQCQLSLTHTCNQTLLKVRVPVQWGGPWMGCLARMTNENLLEEVLHFTFCPI